LIGITKDPKTLEYIIVMHYSQGGSLRSNLQKICMSSWKVKLRHLAVIIAGLKGIHDLNLIHGDLHSDNIFLSNYDTFQIGDLGFTKLSKNYSSKNEELYGVLPYVAPEVLKGDSYTQAADIYSFGMLMWSISTGRFPFENDRHNDETILAIKITINGLRPEFAQGTPNFYIDLAMQCMKANPMDRPSAKDVSEKLEHWMNILKTESNLLKEDQLKISNAFLSADNIISNMLETSQHHQQNDVMYPSKLINTSKILKAINVEA
ncbi:kinase-like domain-containing protein, partial [Gigaspora rosea]